jgi:S-adenosylmethionine hydrolase
MPITLTTDFGLEDPFVGIMKGVILNIAPDAQIIDIFHNIKPQNVAHGAWVLQSAQPYFPDKSIHVAVVDPGVDSDRRAIAVQTGKQYFVGPDNGILTPAITSKSKIVELTNEKYFLQPVSASFHGRDIFAPVAGWLAKGTRLASLGKAIKDPVLLDLPQPGLVKNTLVGEIIHIDHFGNLTSNISRAMLYSFIRNHADLVLQMGRIKIQGLSNNYSCCKAGENGLIINSWDKLEIFCRDGNANQKMRAVIGKTIKITRKK